MGDKDEIASIPFRHECEDVVVPQLVKIRTDVGLVLLVIDEARLFLDVLFHFVRHKPLSLGCRNDVLFLGGPAAAG